MTDWHALGKYELPDDQAFFPIPIFCASKH
jgi:hypothetical protein